MRADSSEGGSGLCAKRTAVWLLACSAASCVSEPPRAPQSEPAWVAAPADDEGAEPALGVTPDATPDATPEATPDAEQGELVDVELPPEWPSKTGAPPPAQPGSGDAAAPEERAHELPLAADRGWLHGSLSVRYRGRSTDDDSDHELFNVLTLDMADPGTPWIRGHLMGRMDIDLDDLDEGEIFEDLSDTYDGSVITKLYLAYADIELDRHPSDSPGTLRVGRQSDARLPEVLRLDGLSYLTRPMGARELELGVYGGIPARLYESSPEGDLAFGTFVEGRPWKNGRARLDWMHLEDELVLGEERDDLIALGLWQEVSARWRLEGEFSHLEGDPRDLRLRSLFDGPESETLVRVAYYELLETQKQRVAELDPFYDELLEYFPFRQATLDVSRAFGEHTLVDAGIDVRRVSHSEDVGEFNREWERYYATATLHDLVAEGLALSVTADRWDDEDQDTSSFGADVSYAADERWQAAIGSYYSLYKYQLLELSEREDVRTYYLRASRELSARLDLDFLYEFENDDLETYHTVRLGVLWQF